MTAMRANAVDAAGRFESKRNYGCVAMRCKKEHLHDDAIGGGDAVGDASGGRDQKDSSGRIILGSSEELLSNCASVICEYGDDDGRVLGRSDLSGELSVGVDGLVGGAGVLFDP